MIIADTCAWARFWHSSTPPMTTEHILAPMWCHQLWLLSSHVRDILALISRQRGRQRRWSSIFIWIGADAFSCSAPVCWKTVFAPLCVRTDEKCDDNPCYFLSPSLTLSQLFMMTLEHTISFTKRRRTSISQFQTKMKWNVNTFHNWWGLCVSMEKNPTEPDAPELDFKIQNGWKLREITNDWNGIGEMDRTFRDVDMQCRKASLHFECFTKWFDIHPAADLRHHFHKVSTQVFFYVSVINNTPICTVVLYLSDIPNASMITTEKHI